MRSLLASTLMITTVWISTGCSSWRVQQVSPAQLIEQRKPSSIQLRWQDGRRLVVRQPVIAGDSLIGVSRKDTIRVATSDVSAVAMRRFDPLKTTGLVVVSTGALFGIACAMACGFGSFGGFGY